MIAEALSFIDPTDRDTWVRCAMAVKSELGDEGFSIWDAWSAQAASYKASDAKSVWRSIKPFGGITAASLYAEAKKSGWGGNAVANPRPIVRRDPAKDVALEQRRRRDAAAKARKMVEAAAFEKHLYLGTKGFCDHQGLVLDGLLLVPMRDMNTSQINSVQTITAGGEKKFLFGGKAKGSVFVIGPKTPEVYLVEGYATGLSVKAAIDYSFRRARVVVCFSAANLAYVAKHMGCYAIADNDESGTGEKYAIKSGLPWWMPPEVGDANDWHMKHGLKSLAAALADLRVPGVATVRG